MRRGWEFWLGVSFVAVAIGLIAPAYMLDSWRDVVSSMGAATAAFAVVGASLIAYDGALAKVRYDRSQEIEQRKNSRQQLLAKLEFTSHLIVADAKQVRRSLDGAMRHDLRMTGPTVGAAEDFEFREPPEMADLWNSLSEFPSETVDAIGKVRLQFIQYSRLIAGYRQMTTPAWLSQMDFVERRRALAELVDTISVSAEKMRSSKAMRLAA